MFDNEPFLRGLETRLDTRYVVVRDGDRPVAAAACYLFRSPDDLVRVPAYYEIGPYYFKALSLPGTPEPPREGNLPLVVVGPPVSGTEHRLLVRPGLSEEERVAAVRKLVERVEAIGEEIGARVVSFAHLRLPNLKTLLTVRPDAIPAVAGAMMFLDVPPSFEEWLERLRAKSRQNVRREMRHFAEAGLRNEIHRFDECRSFVEPLYLESLQRHSEGYGEHLSEMTRTTFEACHSANEYSRVFVTMAGDRPVGASVRFRWGTLYQSKGNVHDTSVGKKAALYFNQVNAAVMEACREGVKTIDFGGAANEAKLLRGCRATPGISALLPRRDCPLPRFRGFLLEQNRRLLREWAKDVERFGQFDDQAEQDLGPPLAFMDAMR